MSSLLLVTTLYFVINHLSNVYGHIVIWIILLPGCPPWFEVDPLVPITVKGRLNAAAYSDSVDNSVRSMLSLQFGTWAGKCPYAQSLLRKEMLRNACRKLKHIEDPAARVQNLVEGLPRGVEADSSVFMPIVLEQDAKSHMGLMFA